MKWRVIDSARHRLRPVDVADLEKLMYTYFCFFIMLFVICAAVDTILLEKCNG
jgi:hypothetical protein